MRILFVDPGSRSTGWALFENNKFVRSGTITNKSPNVFARLWAFWSAYKTLGEDLHPDEVHIERMNYKTHFYCTWSAGLIGTALHAAGVPKVEQDISPGTWQKAVDWKGGQEALLEHRERVDSLDELAAISMGIYWGTK